MKPSASWRRSCRRDTFLDPHARPELKKVQDRLVALERPAGNPTESRTVRQSEWPDRLGRAPAKPQRASRNLTRGFPSKSAGTGGAEHVPNASLWTPIFGYGNMGLA